MRVKKIYTNDILLVKDYLIRIAIKNGYQYIDIGNELHIEDNIFYLFDNKELDNMIQISDELINEIILTEPKFDLTKLTRSIEYITDNEELVISNNSIPKFKKNDYIKESRKTKAMIKKRGIK